MLHIYCQTPKKMMNELRQAIRQIIRETYMDEAGFPRVVRTMTGNVPNVRTVVIVTAANPGGRPVYGKATPDAERRSNEFNNKAMAKLYSMLSDWKYGYTKLKGMYDYAEPSVLVGGMSKGEGRKLAQKFFQESFIFGYLKDIGPEKSVMEYELVFVDGQPGPKKEIVISNSEVQDYDNYYSMVGTRKFQIPFYDDAFSNKRLPVGQSAPEDIEDVDTDDLSYRQKQSLKGKQRKIALSDTELD